jgi:hypothetical protein
LLIADTGRVKGVMPVIYLKSGGYVEVEGYTIREGCLKAIGATFKDTNVPEKSAKQSEAAIPLDNILYILSQKV